MENHDRWRDLVVAILQQRLDLRVIGELSDGLEAVGKAQELQPDLILLDIGLPSLNGIEAARRIRKLCPQSEIIFVSQVLFADVVQEALKIGAQGYVVKTDAGRELLTAVSAVLRGERFLSTRCLEHGPSLADERSAKGVGSRTILGTRQPHGTEIPCHHEVGFYSNERNFLDHVSPFVGTALKAGNAAIVVVTDAHRRSLLPRLVAYGLDIHAAIKQGRYVMVDAADSFSMYMVEGMPDPVRFIEGFGSVILKAAEAANRGQSRVAIFGEGVHLLCAKGNAEAAIKVEELCNQLTLKYDVDILCGYSLNKVQSETESHVYQRICAEHSAVYSR